MSQPKDLIHIGNGQYVTKSEWDAAMLLFEQPLVPPMVADLSVGPSYSTGTKKKVQR